MGSSPSVGSSQTYVRETSSISSPQRRILVPEGSEKKKKAQPDWRKMSADGRQEFTETEIKTRTDKLSKILNTAIDNLEKIQDLRTDDGRWKDDLLSSLEVINKTYVRIGKIDCLAYDVIQKYRRHAGQRLSMSKSIGKMCKVIIDGWKRGYLNQERTTDAHQFQGIKLSLLILLKFTGCSPEVTKDVANESDFLETAKAILTIIFPAYLRRKATNNDVDVMNWCLSILDNISKMKENIPKLRSHQFVPVFKFFLGAMDSHFPLAALSALANIADEKEIGILQDKADLVEFLSQTLSSAADDPHQRSNGWSAQECVMTLRRLARNDENKKLLVEKHCLRHLVQLAKCGSVEEQREPSARGYIIYGSYLQEFLITVKEAVQAIFILIYKERNHVKTLDKEELNTIDFLIEFKETSIDEEVRKAIDGTLFNRLNELKKKKKYKKIVNFIEEKNNLKRKAADDRKGHIMISYNWSHQKKVLKIRDALQEHGYNVWIDTEQMSGSVLQAMAYAVENAHVVLVCISQNYKDSPNCRLEAEYACERKKTIIPLKMEKGYTPDGWLGLILGPKLFFEFSGKYPFKEKIKDLIVEINKHYGSEKMELKVDINESEHEETMEQVDAVSGEVKPKKKDADGVDMALTTRKAVYSAQPALLASLLKWTPDDVDKWIEKHKLPRQYFGKLRGCELAILLTMRLEAPEFFYKYLQKNLGISSLQTMTMFIKGLEDL